MVISWGLPAVIILKAVDNLALIFTMEDWKLFCSTEIEEINFGMTNMRKQLSFETHLVGNTDEYIHAGIKFSYSYFTHDCQLHNKMK